LHAPNASADGVRRFTPAVAVGKMDLRKAKHEIQCMERIVSVLKALEIEQLRTLNLFA
jgi:hypothetical protein